MNTPRESPPHPCPLPINSKEKGICDVLVGTWVHGPSPTAPAEPAGLQHGVTGHGAAPGTLTLVCSRRRAQSVQTPVCGNNQIWGTDGRTQCPTRRTMCFGQLARSHGANVILSGSATEQNTRVHLKLKTQIKLLHLGKHPRAESHKGNEEGVVVGSNGRSRGRGF